MSHKTPDDDFDLPNFDDLVGDNTQGRNTAKDTAEGGDPFVFDEDFFSSRTKKTGRRSQAEDAWDDADPDQVDAVLSALNRRDKSPAQGQKSGGQQSVSPQKSQEPDAFQVSAVLAALK
ncbi:MAG: hypothetical protein LUG57_10095, partial [Oscillospiraceae bacterium]|nr:hypothetical protein [Oscillospiraceae bacterium]